MDAMDITWSIVGIIFYIFMRHACKKAQKEVIEQGRKEAEEKWKERKRKEAERLAYLREGSEEAYKSMEISRKLVLEYQKNKYKKESKG